MAAEGLRDGLSSISDREVVSREEGEYFPCNPIWRLPLHVFTDECPLHNLR